MIRIYLIFAILITAVSFANAQCEPIYKIPGGESPYTLFFIEKNNNANTVFYDINLDEGGYLNGEEPLLVYWRMFAKNGEKQKLRFIEKNLAFGINSVKEIVAGHKYSAKIASMKRDIFIIYENGCGRVETTINGKQAVLGRIMLELEGPVYFSTLIYMDIYGKDVETGEEIMERWYYN